MDYRSLTKKEEDAAKKIVDSAFKVYSTIKDNIKIIML